METHSFCQSSCDSPKFCGNYAFQQNINTTKLAEIKVILTDWKCTKPELAETYYRRETHIVTFLLKTVSFLFITLISTEFTKIYKKVLSLLHQCDTFVIIKTSRYKNQIQQMLPSRGVLRKKFNFDNFIEITTWHGIFL